MQIIHNIIYSTVSLINCRFNCYCSFSSTIKHYTYKWFVSPTILSRVLLEWFFLLLFFFFSFLSFALFSSGFGFSNYFLHFFYFVQFCSWTVVWTQLVCWKMSTLLMDREKVLNLNVTLKVHHKGYSLPEICLNRSRRFLLYSLNLYFPWIPIALFSWLEENDTHYQW